ncbi:hypothetical protein QFC22_003828 [Naganishia vaughanmartiniae]|uniref:Uncharacterized protein n=1 Tax=Naganishia vaughanmartiniae TaxID=1424756 RepID=A0ACC2X4G5_9TREE|nr:hypothetical protein QFC22_003828 [Naganishia vaughanmartiniae]
MVRIIIKGGVWRNTEDEILKAAISKYGKNQWARISSLLVRKTPKQCKARWYEWLDPSIKKVEWSKTEDEKLLHLAKLMPTQWRTIAPIVGRTATQCLERYQKLLDEAEARENDELGLGGPGGEAGPASTDDVKRLRVGEVDVDQETKAARPDPVDMDEDEKEMLSEARARLANTQGKKAKRKARERQLEEARRLAALQKKRELKAAGIILRHKNKKGGMDYNADIPFNKQPVPGFYDTTEENAKKYEAPVGQSLRQLEGKRRTDMEDNEEKKKRQKKEKDGGSQNAQFIAAREAQLQKLKEADQVIKRRRLALPQPQVGEAELEDIVKIGRSSQATKEMIAGGGGGAAGEASDRLIGEYDPMKSAMSARTPRTAPQEDNVMAEARNLRNMTVQQTPLLGDENTPMRGPSADGTGFEGATPRHQVSATPNPLATPFRRDGTHDVSATPRSDAGTSAYSETPLRTPMRDDLSINRDDASAYGATPRDVRLKEQQHKRSLRAGFASLPAPENNFEFDEPEDVGDENDDDAQTQLREEDAAERDARLKAAREEAERKALARRSAVVKLDLPRPVRVNLQRLVDDLEATSKALRAAEMAEIDQLVDYELAQLMLHDAISHPLPGSNIPGGTQSQYEVPEDEYVDAARAEIHKELAANLELPGANEAQLKQAIIATAREDETFMTSGWSIEKAELVYSAEKDAWADAADVSPQDKEAGMAQRLNLMREKMISESAKAIKAEKKLAKQLGGYQMLNSKLKERITTAAEGLRQQKREYDSFTMLKVQEEASAPVRLEHKREEVEKLERRERDLQSHYAELADRRRELLARVEQLEEDKTIADAQDALDAEQMVHNPERDFVAVDDAEVEAM